MAVANEILKLSPKYTAKKIRGAGSLNFNRIRVWKNSNCRNSSEPGPSSHFRGLQITPNFAVRFPPLELYFRNIRRWWIASYGRMSPELIKCTNNYGRDRAKYYFAYFSGYTLLSRSERLEIIQLVCHSCKPIGISTLGEIYIKF